MAQVVVKLQGNPYQNLGKKIGFVEDNDGDLNFNEIELFPDSAFRLGKNDIFNGGTEGKVWWMKLKYTNTQDIWPYLVLDYGNIDYIDIYYRDTLDHIKHISSGTFAENDQRAFKSTEYIFQLPGVKGATKEIFVRVKAVNTLIVPVKLIDGITLAKSLLNKYIWQLLYIGIAFSLFLFNLFMLFSTRDKRYGQYIIRIIFLFYLYVLAYLNGYAHFFNHTFAKFILIHAQAFAAIGFIASILFNNSFLRIKKYMPASVKWFNLLIVLWGIILILSLWDNRDFTNRFAQVLLFITSCAIFYTSIRTIQRIPDHKRNPFIMFYILGWIPICVTTVYVVLALVKIVPINDYTLKVLNAAGIIEAILITLALLGDRIRLLRRGKEKAEQQSIELIRERNVYLEQKIEERTRELQQVNAALQESNGFKDKLFSIIAHDMRSPLSSLRLVLQLADRDMLSPDKLSVLLGNIRTNTEQVQKTMDNLLNWSISQMNLQRYQPEVVNINSFLNDHMAIYQTLANEKKMATNVCCPEGLFLLADKNQLSLIIRNLIDNAIKFTPKEGTIEIGLKQHDNHALIYVTNSGKQIPHETIMRILSNNQNTLDSSYGTAQEKGTGLGLQLCKEFLKNLDSELKIESTGFPEDAITVFSFEIRLYQNV